MTFLVNRYKLVFPHLIKTFSFKTQIVSNSKDAVKTKLQPPKKSKMQMMKGYVFGKSNNDISLKDPLKYSQKLYSDKTFLEEAVVADKTSHSGFPQSDSILEYMSHPLGAMKQESLDPSEKANKYLAQLFPEQSTAFMNEKLFPYIKCYSNLGKIRLTALVVISAASGYAMTPGGFQWTLFGSLCFGTMLTSFAANSINQILEVPYDSQMNRTKNRPIVTGRITPINAALFAASSSLIGISLLAIGANFVTAALGFLNMLLYTVVYTPMKRFSLWNTWVGSFVGAVPPLMGWSAVLGWEVWSSPGALLTAALLLCWQFPHFMALSWNLRPDYARAGYQMCSVLRPNLCTGAALRHSVLLTALCGVAPMLGVTHWYFFPETLPINLWLCWLSWSFHRRPDSSSSRRLFKYSLIHLPLLMMMLILCKSAGQHAFEFDAQSKLAKYLQEHHRYSDIDILNNVVFSY